MMGKEIYVVQNPEFVGSIIRDNRGISLLEEKNALKKQLHEQVSEIYEQLNVLEKEIEPLLLQELYDSGVLKQAIWNITFSSTGLVLESNCKKHERLANLFQNDYHCSIKIEKDIDIRFDDWEIRLIFKSISKGIEFINKHEIKTNIDEFKSKREQLKLELNELEKFITKLEKVK